jgi:predicted N-acetyltransferase YhbS
VVTVRRIAELELGADLAGQLTGLLRESFPDYPDRPYFKLPPHFRYVATADGEVVGHVGVELRMIRVGDRVLRTLGLVDVCVRAGARSHGLATRLLAEVTESARHGDIDFVILFADDDRVYTRNGWVRVDNPVTWVKVHEHTTVGLAERVATGEMMVLPTGEGTWPDGDVDLLGHRF